MFLKFFSNCYSTYSVHYNEFLCRIFFLEFNLFLLNSAAKEYGLQPIGSFRCLNGKVDLSTYEAEHTLQYWQKELERLRKETSVHAIAKEISAANTPVAVKVFAYKNGDAKRRIGELIVGSSVSGVSCV